MEAGFGIPTVDVQQLRCADGVLWKIGRRYLRRGSRAIGDGTRTVRSSHKNGGDRRRSAGYDLEKIGADTRLSIVGHDRCSSPIVTQPIDHRASRAQRGSGHDRCGHRPAALHGNRRGALNFVARRKCFHQTEDVERGYAQTNHIQRQRSFSILLFNLKTSVEPQRHREHRGKTKRYDVAGAHPSGESSGAGNRLFFRSSLYLCVSVVRGLGSMVLSVSSSDYQPPRATADS